MNCVGNSKSTQLKKLPRILKSSIIQSLRIFGAPKDVCFEFTISSCFWKIGKIPNWAGPPVSDRFRTARPAFRQQLSPPLCCRPRFSPPFCRRPRFSPPLCRRPRFSPPIKLAGAKTSFPFSLPPRPRRLAPALTPPASSLSTVALHPPSAHPRVPRAPPSSSIAHRPEVPL
jgi:hypothetical protein